MSSRDGGIGRVFIPDDRNMTRDQYIRKVYDTGRVSIFAYGAGILRQISVAKHCINDLEFPISSIAEDGSIAYGSAVAYMKVPNREEYIIYAVLKEVDDVYDTTEHQFSIGKTVDSGIVKIAGDADKGGLTITVNHNKNGGTFTINVGNDNVASAFVLNISGDFNAEANNFNILAYDKFSLVFPSDEESESTEISYIKGSGFNYSDEFGNVMQFGETGVVLKNSKDNFKDIISDILNSIEEAEILTPAGAGTVSPDTVAKLQELNVRLNTLFK